MKRDLKLKALEIIADEQLTASPVTIKIGTTYGKNQKVHSDVIVIINAPASIIRALKEAGYSLSMSEKAGGLTVSCF